MKEFKKNIILLPAEYNGVNNLKGIITLECKENIKCNLRCYNFKDTNEEYLLGIMVNDDVFKTRVSNKDLNNLTYLINKSAKQDDKISCVLLNVNASQYDIVLWGSTETTNAWKTTLINSLDNVFVRENEKLDINDYKNKKHDEKLKKNNEFKVNEKIENLDEEFEANVLATKTINEDKEYEKEQEQVEKYIDNIIKATSELDEMNTKLKGEEKEDASQSTFFFDRVKGQIEDLFSQNEADLVLEDIIPESKFCKVSLEDGHYVFGVIRENGIPKYLCYGLPANDSSNPPKELEGLCQWLPIDINEENGKGYFMSYQDAETGDNVKVEVIS